MSDLYSLRAHPAAEAFPMMGDAELAELAEDIKANGLRTPVVVIDVAGETLVLDGRNRLRAAHMAGLPTVASRLFDGPDPVAYVLSTNLHRRHLTESQRAMVGATLKRLLAVDAKERQRGGQGGVLLMANLPEAKGASRDKAAELVNVSPRLVQTAETVLEKGAPELVDAVRRGDVKVSTAAVLTRLPAAEQASVVADGSAKARAAEIRAPVADEEPDDGDEDEVFVGDDDPPPARESERTRQWGGFDATDKVAEITRLAKDFCAALDAAWSTIDPRFESDVRARAQDALLLVTDAVVARLPPDGRHAQETRMKFQILKGGR